MGQCSTCSSCSSSCSSCGKQKFRAGRTRKKSVSLKGGKTQRISARREFKAGAKPGTRYKVSDGRGGYNWKTLQLNKNKTPFLSSSKEKRRASFARKRSRRRSKYRSKRSRKN